MNYSQIHQVAKQLYVETYKALHSLCYHAEQFQALTASIRIICILDIFSFFFPGALAGSNSASVGRDGEECNAPHG